MKPSAVSAAATLLRALAAAPEPTCKALAECAEALLRIPSDHPLRAPHDAVLELAEAVRRGRCSPEKMAAEAGKLEREEVRSVVG